MLKSFESSLIEMMDYEDFGQTLAQSGPEFAEGLAALVGRRAPDYQAAAKRAGFSDGMRSARIPARAFPIQRES